MLQHFFNGANEHTQLVEEINASEINLEYCKGCLRCNLIGRCSISDDDWEKLSEKILDSDIIVFASPIYFHHISAQLKKILDRFRSFVHVQLSETEPIHTPRQQWNKDFVLLLTMGSSIISDAKPVIELFKYMTAILGKKNIMHVITAHRLAMIKQVIKTEDELKEVYLRLKLPVDLAKEDYKKNQKVLKDCFDLGSNLANTK